MIKRTTVALMVIVAILAAATSPAMAAGPQMQVIIVHITDGGSEATSVSSYGQLSEIDGMLITVNEEGISAEGWETDGDGNAWGWGAGPDGIHDEQRELGDTAAGLMSASENCNQGFSCHVILVNHQRPSNRLHRIAAKAAADELMASGHRLHAIAVGPSSKKHTGFNWYLSGQAFSAAPDELVELILQVAGYAYMVTEAENTQWTRGNQPLAEQWDSLSRIEKIWLNPLNCNLKTQWLSAYDGTCHDKS